MAAKLNFRSRAQDDNGIVQRVHAQIALLALLPMLVNSATPRALIIDSGSTNRAGVTITVDAAGNATVEQRGAQPQNITLGAQICEQLMRDIKSAGTLSALPQTHCAKSVSFGSSLYIEMGGDRSPDLSCGQQQDPRAAALQKDARAVLQAVQKLGVTRVRPVRPVTAVNPQ